MNRLITHRATPIPRCKIVHLKGWMRVALLLSRAKETSTLICTRVRASVRPGDSEETVWLDVPSARSPIVIAHFLATMVDVSDRMIGWWRLMTVDHAVTGCRVGRPLSWGFRQYLRSYRREVYLRHRTKLPFPKKRSNGLNGFIPGRRGIYVVESYII